MPSISSISALLLLPATIAAVSLDCENIVAGGQHFNLKTLGGPKEVHHVRHTPPTITNDTITIDICQPLKRIKETPKEEQCSSGTWACFVRRIHRKDKDEEVEQVRDIAGQYKTSHGRHLDPIFTRLKDSESNSDSKEEGLRIELHGGKWSGKDQKAIIEFKCDNDWEGTEGFEDPKVLDMPSYGSMSKREDKDDGEGDDDGDEGDEPLPDPDNGKALQFQSFNEEKGSMDVLRLTWKTKYACENAKPPSGDKKSGGGLGWFGTFFVIVFLLIAAYIIFGSWLNYNRYGARGWDLIPHGDTIRDIPYIIKDWSSGISDRLKSGGSRGGYSAV